MSYWSQWSSTELLSIQGVEPEDCEIEDEEVDGDFEEEDKEPSCPRCSGHGCNYCLMVDY